MGKSRGVYHEEYPVGTRVRIVGKTELERFANEWKLHNSLKPEQLKFAGEFAQIEEVGFYHGGDELYKLKGVPGVWHEQCLTSENNDKTV
jgi:hypothetical protein